MAASVNNMEVSGEILGGQVSFKKQNFLQKMFKIANENAPLAQNEQLLRVVFSTFCGQKKT